MKATSPAFEQYHTIPKRYTCDGEDLSPPLAFQDMPKNVRSFALIVEDPDAPKGTFDHWIAWNIAAETTVLAEGIKAPQEGLNSYGSHGYRGPCPPPGKPHRYFFKVFALDTVLELPETSGKSALLKAMQGHILAETELVGTYGR